jgi:hypothetical protein
MRAFAQRAAGFALAIALGVVMIYSAAALAMGIVTLERTFPSPLGGVAALVVFVVAIYGFACALQWAGTAIERLERQLSLEPLRIRGAKRVVLILAGVLTSFGVVVILSQLFPGPVPTPVSVSVTAIAVVFAVAGLFRRLHRRSGV